MDGFLVIRTAAGALSWCVRGQLPGGARPVLIVATSTLGDSWKVAAAASAFRGLSPDEADRVASILFEVAHQDPSPRREMSQALASWLRTHYPQFSWGKLLWAKLNPPPPHNQPYQLPARAA